MKKALRIGRRVTVILLALFVVIILIASFLSMFYDTNGKKSIFGLQLYSVLSDSMKGTFSAGDMLFVKDVDVKDLKAGDIITFLSRSDVSYGQVVTHKIRKVNFDEKGNPVSFVTYGTAVEGNDTSPAEAKDIYGKYVFRIPKGGSFVDYLQTTQGIILLLILPLGIMIVIESIQLIMIYRKHKTVKLDEINEQGQIEKELNEEINKLKEKLKHYQADEEEDRGNNNKE